MRNIIFFVLIGSLAWGALWSCTKKKETPEKHTEHILISQVDSFSLEISKIQHYLKNPVVDTKKLQELFLASRLAYKKFEWAAEYYTPTVTRLVNGPPVAEIEAGGQHVINPAGLQVIEAHLFPNYNNRQKNELNQQLQLLQTNCNQYKAYFQHIDMYNWQIFDASKLQVFRILTLGITGFDNPLSLNSSRECEASLVSLQNLFADYTSETDSVHSPQEFYSAINYLHQHTNFNAFNRAEFITVYGNPLTIALTKLRRQLDIPVVKFNRLINQESPTLFAPQAFNADAFVPGEHYVTTKERIALGKKLFFDPQLSGTLTRSCSSCHRPEMAFTDGLTKSTLIDGTGSVRRNTPTLINAALQPTLFYDQRVNTLEDQVRDVMQNKQEMHGNLKKAVVQLWQDQAYRQLFMTAYPATLRMAIDTFEVMNALGAYVRSLTQLNSRFDDYMRGNKTAINTSELNGFNLFMGKAKCGTCHYMPLFNGTLPPAYTKMDAEVIGVPASKSAKIIDADLGRFDILQFPSLKHAFKTPTVRNAGKTAPYMHNGVFANLREVIDFYNKGGGAGAGLKIENQTLSADKLNLSTKETEDLIAFINSLDSSTK